MLRLIFINFSVFLLLSTLNLQNAQARPGVAAVRGAARVAQMAQVIIQAPRGAQAISSFTSSSGIAQQIIQLAGSFGMKKDGANIASTLQWIESVRNDHHYTQLDAVITEIEGQGSYGALGQLRQQLTQFANANNINLEQDAFAVQYVTNDAVVADQVQVPPVLSPEAAAFAATDTLNKDAVADAVGNAYIMRAANYGLAQMSTLGMRLINHLRQVPVAILGHLAERCPRDWDNTDTNNTALGNFAHILLGVDVNTTTMAYLKQQLPKLFHAVIDRGLKAGGSAWTALMNAPLQIADRIRSIERINTLADPLTCGMTNPATAMSPAPAPALVPAFAN